MGWDILLVMIVKGALQILAHFQARWDLERAARLDLLHDLDQAAARQREVVDRWLQESGVDFDRVRRLRVSARMRDGDAITGQLPGPNPGVVPHPTDRGVPD